MDISLSFVFTSIILISYEKTNRNLFYKGFRYNLQILERRINIPKYEMIKINKDIENINKLLYIIYIKKEIKSEYFCK